MHVSPQELRHVTTQYQPNGPGRAASAPPGATAGPIGVVTAPPGGPTTGTASGATGDGPVLVSLKQSLAAAGFSASNVSPSTSDDDAQAAMHGFTHAFFDSVQAQRQADAAAGNPTTMRGAMRELSAQAAEGNAPADLQSAFDTLQQTQVAGSPASSSTLSQVLAGMAKSAPDEYASSIGSLVNASA